jgi:ATP-dependent Lhr-like helicase
MTKHPFYRLAPFIQEFIYRKRWESLRAVQVEALGAILDTPSHVLITSGTASGKTEAALLPILTQLHQHPASSIGVMYIGPLKALINDQFERLQALLDETGIPIQSWHGDIDQAKKTRFLKRAQGILQITPESLEAMLINRHSDLNRLFGDLRFVVIDELHAFISTDRGRQVLCQLQRLARYQVKPARRIGLSATLGEPQKAVEWLAGGTTLPVIQIEDRQSQREIHIGLEHFVTEAEDAPEGVAAPAEDDQNLSSEGATYTEAELLNEVPTNKELYQHIFALTRSATKTLVFTNKRSDAEQVIVNLRRLLLGTTKEADFYHVHHGSISAPLREAAEAAMRDPHRKACVAATLTLELGIDIGQLDQVLQINATHSVSSFVQRLGRSGRRGGPARMFFYCQEVKSNRQTSLGEQIPWQLLQTIATIQLYLEEKWVEPPEIPQLPFSLLYHQTMSVLLAHTELTPAQLAERVLTLSPFANVTQEHYRSLLRYLLELKHLELTETGGLIIGLQGEKVVNNYRFYATFQETVEYTVRERSREIGTIENIPAVGDTIGLAGFAWRVMVVDHDQRLIYVERVRGKAPAAWSGGRCESHPRILERMRQVLREDTHYGYLHEQAQDRLAEARRLARQTGLLENQILPLAPRRYLILPWQGARCIFTLTRILEVAGFTLSSCQCPYYFEITNVDESEAELRTHLETVAHFPLSATQLIENVPRRVLECNKYDKYISDHLLQLAFIEDQLDVPGAVHCLQILARA